MEWMDENSAKYPDLERYLTCLFTLPHGKCGTLFEGDGDTVRTMLVEWFLDREIRHVGCVPADDKRNLQSRVREECNASLWELCLDKC